MLEVYGCYRLEEIFQLTILILWLNAVLLRLLLQINLGISQRCNMLLSFLVWEWFCAWEYLVSLKPTLTGPWLLIGDLNEIILPSESRGGKFLINRAARFQEVIREWCLLDLGLQGLDRALNDCDWRIQFPEAFVEHLCRLHFHHNPIFLRDRPFRFEAAWTSQEGYLSIGGSGCLG
jgi:hypothetical protein